MAHIDLASYYQINFSLVQHHKYSLTEIENMIPWEKDVYVTLLQQYIEGRKPETSTAEWHLVVRHLKHHNWVEEESL